MFILYLFILYIKKCYTVQVTSHYIEFNPRTSRLEEATLALEIHFPAEFSSITKLCINLSEMDFNF